MAVDVRIRFLLLDLFAGTSKTVLMPPFLEVRVVSPVLWWHQWMRSVIEQPQTLGWRLCSTKPTQDRVRSLGGEGKAWVKRDELSVVAGYCNTMAPGNTDER